MQAELQGELTSKYYVEVAERRSRAVRLGPADLDPACACARPSRGRPRALVRTQRRPLGPAVRVARGSA